MSLKRDYMMSMIEQLELFVARLMFLRNSDRSAQAMAEIDEFYSRVAGIDREAMHAVAHNDLVALFTIDGEIDMTTALAVATVLKEEGEFAVREERPEDAASCYSRSLALLLAIYQSGEAALPLGMVNLLEYVRDMAGSYEIPAALGGPLMAYYEHLGLYAYVEDILFEKIERGDGGAVAEALAFYDRLALKDDAELADGGLPREEVEEGRNALQQKQSAS